MKLIKLTRGKFAQVDDADFEWLNQFKWYYHTGYARGCVGKNKIIYMHRFILNAPDGMRSDHKDLDKLNNQRYNIRLCTVQQNNMNTEKRSGFTSKYKGVSWAKRRDKWQAQIKFNYKVACLGFFKCEICAAEAYNREAIKLFGEFARVNNLS